MPATPTAEMTPTVTHRATLLSSPVLGLELTQKNPLAVPRSVFIDIAYFPTGNWRIYARSSSTTVLVPFFGEKTLYCSEFSVFRQPLLPLSLLHSGNKC